MGPQFASVGGDTSCLALAHDGEVPRLIVDAGTGLRSVSGLLAGGPFIGTIVLGHLHLDHLTGLPFFAAADRPDAVVDVRVPEQGRDAKQLMSGVFSPPFFPITTDDLHGDWTWDAYDESTFEASGFEITAREIPHKGGRTMGLRISDATGSVAYLSDHAPHALGPGPDGVGELHAAAVELADGVDVLFHGAQYTREELATRGSFGHAAADYSALLGECCGVGQIVLIHHEPSRTDDAVVVIRDAVAALTDRPVVIGRAGSVIDLPQR